MSEIENLKIYGGATYTVGNENIIANEWEASKTYVKGKSYVINEHKLYVCNTTHTSTNPFDPTNWTEITVGDAIAANTTAIGPLSSLTTTNKDSLVDAVNDLVYQVGDTVSGVNNCYAGVALSTQIRFTIPLDKPLNSDITGASVSGPWSIYCDNSRLLNGQTLDNFGTVATSIRGNCIELTISYGGTTPTLYASAILRGASGTGFTFTDT